RTDTELVDPANVTLGHRSVQRWNLPDGWVISSRLAHPALVSEDDFVAAQDVSAARRPVPQDEPVLRRYLLHEEASAFWVLADAEGNKACITTWPGGDG